MELKDVLTLIIALYGAVIGTILGIREIRREKREVQLFLEIIAKDRDINNVRIVIVNTGHRPVTIIRIGFRLTFIKFRILNLIKTFQNVVSFHFDELHDSLPVTLNDGEQENY